MPLIKSPSKKAFKKNVETEMHAHPDKRAQDLAIAYSIKRKSARKKKASGGTVESGSPDMNMAEGGNLHQGAQEARKYRSQSEEKGVHTPQSPYPHSKSSFGESYAGYAGKADSGVEARTNKPVSRQGMQEESKKEHRRVLNESRSMPKPKLQGLAEGGRTSTSTTGNKTKTGGSNPGGASTGGAGTVTITTGKMPPKGINISNVGGKTAARNAGGMDPGDSEEDDMKKMAEGGSISAYNERRPMPDNRYDDSKSVSRNSGNKPAHDDSWTDQPTVRQAQAKSSRKVMPIKHPKMVPSDAFSVRMRDEEDDLMSSDSPGPYGEQPPKHDDEEGPDRQGDEVPDMQDEHSTHRKPYADGGDVEDEQSQQMEDRPDKGWGKIIFKADGGEVEESDYDHPMNKYEDDLTDLHPSEDEGSMMAHEDDEEGQDRQGPRVPDMEDQHNSGRKPYAEGGMAGDFHEMFDADEHNINHDEELNPAHDKHSADDSEDQPHDEYEEDHDASIASAIMAKRHKEERLMSGSEDMDDMVMMADGGILSHRSIYSDDSNEADLRRNAEEDANEEDQLSFNALRKENYSESAGLRQLDSPKDSNEHGDSEESDSENEHDRSVVGAIRKKMKKKSPITR